MLWQICSSAGAYNFRYRFTLVSQGKATLAKFIMPGQAQDPEENAASVSPSLSKDGKILSSFDKGRGLGDCGVSADWAWDGKTFRLVEYRFMGDCRGVPWDEWPFLFKAQAR